METRIYWITFTMSAVIGVLLAWLATRYRSGGAIIVAGWTGFEIGAAFSNLFYFQFRHKFFFWAIIGMCSIIMPLIAATNINNHMIWITAIFGSYIFIVSFSMFYGRWPLDLNLPKLEEAGAIVTTEPYFFLYMLVWFLMAIIGVVTQCFTLWHFKRVGKQLRPKLQEAIDKFEYGKTPS